MDRIALICSGCKAKYHATKASYQARRQPIVCPACGEQVVLRRRHPPTQAGAAKQTKGPSANTRSPVTEVSKFSKPKQRMMSSAGLVAISVLLTAGVTAWGVLKSLSPPSVVNSVADHKPETHFSDSPTEQTSIDDLLAEPEKEIADLGSNSGQPRDTDRQRQAESNPSSDEIVAAPSDDTIEFLGPSPSRLHYRWNPGRQVTYSYSVYVEPEVKLATDGMCRLTVGSSWNSILEAKRKQPHAIAQAQSHLEKSEVVDTEEGFGSAFVATQDGYLVTCAHVVEDAVEVTVELAGKRYAARVLVMDLENDLALLRIQATGLTPLSVAEAGSVRLSENVRVVGFPLIDDKSSRMTVTRGTVSSLFIEEDGGQVQIDAPINPGNSGGPVVNDRGQVVGVASSRVVHQRVTDVGFAVPTSRVLQMLSHRGVSVDAKSLPAGLSGPDLIEQISPCIGLVRVRVPSLESNGSDIEYWCRHGAIAIPGQGIALRETTVEESGNLTCYSFGNVKGLESTVRLPMLWTHPINLIVEDLHYKGKEQWSYQWTHDIDVQPHDSFGVERRLLEPEQPSRFGRFPTPRISHSLSSREASTFYKAISESDCQVVSRTDDSITVIKNLTTEASTVGKKPAFALNGRAALVFSSGDGLLQQGLVELTCDWKLTPDVRPFIVRFSCVRHTFDQQSFAAQVDSYFDYLQSRKDQEAIAVESRAGLDSEAMLVACMDALEQTLDKEGHAYELLGELAGYPIVEKHRRRAASLARRAVLAGDSFDMRNALKAIGVWGGKKEAIFLIDRLRHSDNDADEIVEALGNIGGAETVEPLVQFLVKATGHFDRRAAVKALIEVGKGVEDKITPLLNHNDEDLREAACDILCEIGTSHSISELRRLVARSESFEKRRAERAIKDIERRIANPRRNPKRISSKRLTSPRHPLAISQAVSRAIETLEKRNANPTLQADALGVLAQQPVVKQHKSKAVELIVPHLNRRSPVMVLLTAIRAIGKWGNSEHAPVLNDLLEKASSRDAKLALFEALGSVGDKRSSMLLAPYLLDEDYCYQVITAFRQLDPKVEQRLLDWLVSDNIQRRCLAAEVLGRAASAQALEAIQRKAPQSHGTIALDPIIKAMASIRVREAS